MFPLIHKSNDSAQRHHLRVVAFAVFGALVGAGLVFLLLPQPATAPVDEVSQTSSSSEIEIDGPTLPEAAPVRLRIPSVGIDTAFEGPLGLNPDQSVEVPSGYDAVGWYQYAPTPGELGPAVVLGHVDSFTGPAVFFSLGQVEIGEVVEIDREDGTTARFLITRLDRRLQSDFPTAEVYGDIDHAGLRLITCSGTYSQGTLEYSHNLIVYARLIE